MEEISKIVKNSKVYKIKRTKLQEEEFNSILGQIPEEAKEAILNSKFQKFSVTTTINDIETTIFKEDDGIYKEELLEEISLLESIEDLEKEEEQQNSEIIIETSKEQKIQSKDPEEDLQKSVQAHEDVEKTSQIIQDEKENNEGKNLPIIKEESRIKKFLQLIKMKISKITDKIREEDFQDVSDFRERLLKKESEKGKFSNIKQQVNEKKAYEKALETQEKIEKIEEKEETK